MATRTMGGCGKGLAVAGLVAAMADAGFAQRGLRDIPDPDVAAQEATFRLPPGAKINLFASDPMISKPIHMNWDGEGRLWVVSSPLYPHIEPGQPETDKVFVLEDADRDGKAEKVTEFASDLYIPTAVLPGDGGAYVANTTEILFLRDNDGDGKADERRVVLSGFGTEDTHHIVHTFRWGPAGMLWFNQSIYIHSHVETPYGVRRLMAGGMWHFRPENGRLEVFMRGLVNPWGHVFDQWGQSFMTDGAGGNGINFVFPRATFATAYEAARTLRGLNPGQPKHCGLEVVSGRHVPEEWRGMLLAPDFRGHRINRFELSDKGSAYVSTQQEDLVASSHRAFRPIDVKMGPDGAIYIADWYNPIIQHGEVDFRDPRRDHKHGRIWRISFPGRELVQPPKIVGAPVEELVKLLDAPEGWTREQATVELRQREPKEALEALTAWHAGCETDLQRLRAVWGMQAVSASTGSFRRDWVAPLLESKNHKVRAAALRALYYEAADHGLERSILAKGVSDPHPQVRLWAVSVLAQLDWPDTVELALRALDGVEVDEFLDFAVWSICREHAGRWKPKPAEGNPFASTAQLLFAVRALNEPVGMNELLPSLGKGPLASDSAAAELVNWVSRTGNAEHLAAMFDYALSDECPPARKGVVLAALADALKIRKLAPAGDKSRVKRFLGSPNPGVFSRSAALAGGWKVEAARPVLEKEFLGAGKDAGRARAALDGLRLLGGEKTGAFLARIAQDESATFEARSLAVIGQTQMNPKSGAALAIPVLQAAPGGRDPHGIVDAFLSRKGGASALAAQLGKPGVTLPQDVALAAMQKAGSAATKPEGLIKALQDAAGLKPMQTQLSPAGMEAMMRRVAEQGDPHRGEKIYRRPELTCIVCHAIGGSGGIIGPDLISVGSSAPVDYLVESLLEPSKKIKEGYHTVLVTTKGGENFAGALAREDAREIVIRDAAGKENRIAKADVASQTVSPVSLMPPGLTASLRDDEFVDLVRFLSELGKQGDFAMPVNRHVREWEVLQPHERIRDDIGHYGPKIFAEDFETYVWTPLTAKVDGTLPADELPKVKARGRSVYGVGRFFLESAAGGEAQLKVGGKLAGVHLFLGEKKVAVDEAGGEAVVTLALKPGRSKVTVVGPLGSGWDGVKVEVLGDAGPVQVVKP
ncbi:MAG: sorbosone dehydrogenase [Akkermansiaceae bacterium]|nr:sorbosone dehydrogenase [Akkermansiaceae bacterium]